MGHEFHFTFANIESQYQYALDKGYQFITLQEYIENRNNLPDKTIVNRVDIDFSVKKADRLRDIYDRLRIKASFFLRLHAPEYNPFSFESYRIIKKIIKSGHELGYHSEIIDQAAIWGEDAAECLKRDIKVMNAMFDIDVRGVASHGGNTGLNNLDFWKDKDPADYDLLYEAYDNSERFGLFKNSFYISDSEWTRWKCYDNGELCLNDRRSFKEHVDDNRKMIYLLIHPDTYFDRHFYE